MISHIWHFTFGIQIKETVIVGNSDYRDKTYYFCSTRCKQSFDNNPKNTHRKGISATSIIS